GRKMAWKTATSGDPGSGGIRGDNAAFASITALAISDLDAAGADQETWIGLLGAADNAETKGLLLIQDAANPTAYMEFKVTAAAADQTGYWTVAVTPVATTIADTGLLADDTGVAIQF